MVLIDKKSAPLSSILGPSTIPTQRVGDGRSPVFISIHLLTCHCLIGYQTVKEGCGFVWVQWGGLLVGPKSGGFKRLQ
jgi:hypothetical protein